MTTHEPVRITIPTTEGAEKLLYESLPHQTEFHLAPETYVLMEGGRGTGKSLAIRWDGHMRAMQWPGFAYLILRRTMPELRKSHFAFIEAEMKVLGGWFNKTESVAYYPAKDGKQSKGYFGHCETEADILNYLSAQFGAIYFDELTTFTQKMFADISSSARATVDDPFIAIVRGGTNPIGEGASWVKQWFIDKTVNLEEFPDYNPADYRSIHSTVKDNPHLDEKTYRKQFSGAAAHVRAAWLDGQWVTGDSYFSDFLHSLDGEPWHVIDDLPTVKGKPLLEQPWISIYRVLDWGFDPDPAVCLWIAVLPNKRAIVFKERQWQRTTAARVAESIVEESRGMKVISTYCDPSMFVSSKATEGQSIGDIFESNGVTLTPSVNDRAACGEAIHEWLNTVIDGEPKLTVLRTGAPNLLRTFPDMRKDKRNPRRIADGEDHWVISLGYFCQSDIATSREPEKSEIPRWMRKPASRRVLGADNVRRSA